MYKRTKLQLKLSPLSCYGIATVGMPSQEHTVNRLHDQGNTAKAKAKAKGSPFLPPMWFPRLASPRGTPMSGVVIRSRLKDHIQLTLLNKKCC
jgi:hypothetical protein